MNNLIPEYNITGLLGGIRLFLCEKRITYLSLFRDEVKNGNVGFVKFVDKNRECRMDLQLKKLPGCCDGSYPLYFINETGKESLSEI